MTILTTSIIFCGAGTHIRVARARRCALPRTAVAIRMQKMKRTEPSTREMEPINWPEFRDWVPTKIATVLLPLGTLEPHGVAPNGTDILAPREIAPHVNAMIAPVTCSGKSQNRSRHSIKSTESGDCENLG